MSYLSFYGLTSEPFSNAPVTRFYYESEQHKQALTRLLYAMQSMKGLAVVVGGIGTGKTTLARRLLDSLPDAEYEAALLVIIHSGVDASWLLKRIAMQLGVIDPAQEKLALLSQLYQRLVQIYESGKKAVVLIDEAQMLATRELMEEFRGLLNLEVPERKLLSLVFFGLPEMYKIMDLDPPLKQRVSLKFALEGLSRESTERYINHRLHLAGAQHAIFSNAAIDKVYESTHGTPRLINTICDNALLEGYLSNASGIDAPLVQQVVTNLGIEIEEHERTDVPAVLAPPQPASEDAAFAASATLSNPVPATGTAKHAPLTRTPPAPAPLSTPAKPLVAKAPAPRPIAAPAQPVPRPATATPRPVATPAVATPAVATPAVATPAVATPAVATPAVATPAVATPAVATPAVATPAVATPAVATPARPATPAPAPRRTQVNLDEIDSLLAEIKKS